MLILQIAAGVFLGLTVFKIYQFFSDSKDGLPDNGASLVILLIVLTAIGYLVWKTW